MSNNSQCHQLLHDTFFVPLQNRDDNTVYIYFISMQYHAS